MRLSDSSEDGRPHAGKDWSSEQYDILSTLRDERFTKFSGNEVVVILEHLSISRYLNDSKNCNEDKE